MKVCDVMEDGEKGNGSGSWSWGLGEYGDAGRLREQVANGVEGIGWGGWGKGSHVNIGEVESMVVGEFGANSCWYGSYFLLQPGTQRHR